MDNQKDIERLIDKLMSEDSLVSPSSDFTKNVMAQLPNEKSSSLVYKPLLPKSFFVVMLALIVLLGVYVFGFYDFAETNPRYIQFLSDSSAKVTDLFKQIKFSQNLSYIIFFGGFL